MDKYVVTPAWAVKRPGVAYIYGLYDQRDRLRYVGRAHGPRGNAEKPAGMRGDDAATQEPEGSLAADSAWAAADANTGQAVSSVAMMPLMLRMHPYVGPVSYGRN